ncbi:MAG: hypothetical protein PVJ92_01600, partial [Candidatus Dependentiae bacterium]
MRTFSLRGIAAFLFCATTLHANYSTTTADITFNTQVFADANRWYLLHTGDPTGLTDAGKIATLSGVALKQDAKTKVSALTFSSLVPKKANINLEVVAKGKAKEAVITDNPLYGAQLHHLAACSHARQLALPVVTYGTPAAGKATSVAWLDGSVIVDGVSYTSALINTAAIADANGAEAERIEGMTCGVRTREIKNEKGVVERYENEEHVIVAVRGNGEAVFNGQNGDGLAVLQKKTTLRAPQKDEAQPDTLIGLVPVDSTGQDVLAKAATVNDTMIKIAGDGDITGVQDVFWDATLQRLFVSLSLNNAGGVGVLVGNLSMTASTATEKERKVVLSLQAIVADENKANIAGNWDTANHVIGIKDSETVAVSHLRTLHSSTGHSYLITVGGVNGLANHVHALPLLRSANDATYGEDAIGTLAQKTDPTKKATAGTELYVAEDEAAWVGGAVAVDTIQDLYVMGDTVYVSYAHATDTAKQGVFASTALFDDKGYIRGWTSWQRVMGRAARTYGGGRDAEGDYWVLTADGSGDINTVTLTSWGTGDGNGLFGGPSGDAAAGLVSQLNVAFPRNEGGVHALYPFAKTNAHLNDGTLLVATGRNKVALVLTEKNDALSVGANFDDERLQIRDLTTNDLDLGMVTCAQISNKGTSSGNGWLFVGGANGLAVLRQTNGEGCDALDDLTGLAVYSFKEITKADGSSFANVRALSADDTNLYVLTTKSLYKIAYDDANKWKDTGAIAAGEVEIATPLALTGQSGHIFITGQLLGNGYLLATTSGLWTMSGAGTTIKNVTPADWRELYVDQTKLSGLGVCADITVLPAATTSGGAGGGNVYVLSADTSLNVSTVYRLSFDTNDCAAATVRIVGSSSTWSHFTILGQLREYFHTDGSFSYDLGSFHTAYEFSTGFGEEQKPAPLRMLPHRSALSQIDVWLTSKQPTALQTRTVDHT